MKKFKNLVLFFAAAAIALGASAQGATSTQTKTATTTSTKAADKVDATQKGPNGQTVYVGPKDGHYYMDKSGKKVYLKSASSTTKTTSTTDTKTKMAGQKPTTTQVKTTTTDQKTMAGGATSQVKTASTATKSSDKVNASAKGPNGETVYTGSKGGNYYLDKTGKKVYLKK